VRDSTPLSAQATYAVATRSQFGQLLVGGSSDSASETPDDDQRSEDSARREADQVGREANSAGVTTNGRRGSVLAVLHGSLGRSRRPDSHIRIVAAYAASGTTRARASA